MKTKRIISTVILLFVSLAVIFASMPAQAASEKTIKGLITSRQGEDMVVRNERGSLITVTLARNTEIKVAKGLLGLRGEEMGITALIPGLRVEVLAETSGGKTIAKSIKFKADDLKRASEIQAGLAMTQKQVEMQKEEINVNEQEIAKAQAESAALSKRFSELGDYDVKAEAIVLFAINSSELSATAKESLQELAANAKKINKYLIHVAGYTDSSGKADYNQELSNRRAAVVVQYLQQECGVEITRVLAPDAMGLSKAKASNETAAGKAENRRVEVKALVNRGLAQ
jgi:outer membrane protein OmpA-like peptidoglycan-associated protein